MAGWHHEQDGGKESYWRGVLQHWRRSGQTVRSYCREHVLSEPSFYMWRRTIEQRDRQAARSCRHRRATHHRDGGPTFVPVTLLAPAPALEVVLGDGRTIRVPAGFDAATLQRLLAALDETPSC
jgi:hypothetical protein